MNKVLKSDNNNNGLLNNISHDLTLSNKADELTGNTRGDVLLKLFGTKEVLLTMFPFLQGHINPADRITGIANARIMDTLKDSVADKYYDSQKAENS